MKKIERRQAKKMKRKKEKTRYVFSYYRKFDLKSRTRVPNKIHLPKLHATFQLKSKLFILA